jgi:hypothetical protein
LRSTLDWSPPCSVDEGLRATGRWFIAEAAQSIPKASGR